MVWKRSCSHESFRKKVEWDGLECFQESLCLEGLADTDNSTHHSGLKKIDSHSLV